MEPVPPDRMFEKRTAPPSGDAEVGNFRQGTPASRWALARYLVGRAIGESIGTTLMLVAVGLVVLAVLVGWPLHLTVVAVLIGLAAVFVLVLRAALLAILRRVTASDRYGPVEQRLRTLVADTRGDVCRELRRIGLPSHLWTLPLLAFRLAGRRRHDTLARLRSFDVGRAVPPGRLDELHLVLREAFGGGSFDAPGHPGSFGSAGR